MNNSFSIKIDAFDGPLDLLLHLVEKNEVEIFDIPIALITEQYMNYVSAINSQEPDMELLSDFLLMAATLIFIKSKMLLPQAVKEEETSESSETDPMEDLVRKLLLYRKFKEVSINLGEKERRESLALYKNKDDSINWDSLSRHYQSNENNFSGLVSIDKLYDIFIDLILRQEMRSDKIRAGFNSVTKDSHSISDKVQHITNILKQHKNVSFKKIFDECHGKTEKITAFLALLELIKINRVAITQNYLFDEITCSLCEGAEN